MLLRYLVSLAALPVMVTVIISTVLVSSLYYEAFWGLHSITLLLILKAGLLLIVGGMVLLYFTIALFVKEGNGTIAPWNPLSKLIVSGVLDMFEIP